MNSTPAILCRKIKLTETSLILTWFTLSDGLLKTVAKGALRPKSRFSGVLDLFHLCEIQFSRSAKSDLHSLSEATLVNAHEAIRFDYPRLATAAYFVELIEIVSEPGHPAPEIYDLLNRGVAYLASHPASQRALVHFESELVRLQGIQYPGATAAVSIGKAYHRLPSSRRDLLHSLT